MFVVFWSCSNTANTMLELVRRSSPVSPISSVPLGQQMWWRAVRCPPINTLHGYRDAGRRWPGSSTAGCTAPTIPAASDTSFPFYMLCPLPLVTSSGDQQLRAVRRGDLFSYLLLLKPFFNIHDTWWTLGSKWYRQSDDLLQEVIKITFGPACHINYQYETGAEYVVCRAA